MPEHLGIDQIRELLSIWSAIQNFGGECITLDFSQVRWIDVMGLCLLSHWFDELRNRKVTVILENLSIDIESYMWRMDLIGSHENLRYNDRCSGRRRHDQSKNLVEVCAVTDASIADDTAYRMAQTIISKISSIPSDPDPEGMRATAADQATTGLGYVFSELLDNSLTHGRRGSFASSHPKVAIQYVRARGRISLAILDNGCGLLETLRNHERLQERTDMSAISLALEPRVSCNRALGLAGSQSVNQGIGLTVSTNLALKNGGKFTVFSGLGYYNQGANGASRVTESLDAGWRGTGVYLDFNVQNIGALVPSEVITELPGYREERKIRFG